MRRAVALLLPRRTSQPSLLPYDVAWSTLAAAADSLHYKPVETLLERGSDINRPLSIGIFGRASAAVIADGFEAVAQVLLDAGADANMPLPEEHGNVFARAAKRNEPDALERVLDAGAVPRLLFHGSVMVAVMNCNRDPALRIRILQRLVDVGSFF